MYDINTQKGLQLFSHSLILNFLLLILRQKLNPDSHLEVKILKFEEITKPDQGLTKSLRHQLYWHDSFYATLLISKPGWASPWSLLLWHSQQSQSSLRSDQMLLLQHKEWYILNHIWQLWLLSLVKSLMNLKYSRQKNKCSIQTHKPK